jgi:hypothetical protein
MPRVEHERRSSNTPVADVSRDLPQRFRPTMHGAIVLQSAVDPRDAMPQSPRAERESAGGSDGGQVFARVLSPGGVFLSQQVGAGSNRELYEFMMGPQPDSAQPSPKRAAAEAEAAGMAVVDLRSEALRVVFNDVGAIVHFLRKVLWTVPGFTGEAYRDRLAALRQQIQAQGPLVAHSQRFLIEARKPG